MSSSARTATLTLSRICFSCAQHQTAIMSCHRAKHSWILSTGLNEHELCYPVEVSVITNHTSEARLTTGKHPGSFMAVEFPLKLLLVLFLTRLFMIGLQLVAQYPVRLTIPARIAYSTLLHVHTQDNHSIVPVPAVHFQR